MDKKNCVAEEESHTDDSLPLNSCILKDVHEGKIKLIKNSFKVEHIGPHGELKSMIQQNNIYFHEYMIFSNTIRSMINLINVDPLPPKDIKVDSCKKDSKISVSFAALPDIIINYNRMFFGEYDENPYVCKYTNKDI